MEGKVLDYNYFLNKLKKDELLKVLEDYNFLADVFGFSKVANIKGKKNDLIKFILDVKENYIEYLIKSMDYQDFLLLREIVLKGMNIEECDINKEFIKYLIDKKVVFVEEDLVIPSDIYDKALSLVKSRDLLKYIKMQDERFKLTKGIILAYGVIDRAYFDELVGNSLLMDFYYKKDYVIDDKMVVSKKLSNKKRINKYFKNKDYKKFTNKELLSLGLQEYHHNIKSFKKLIRMLKSNYVFKKCDIDFVDKKIVIPYLYTSLNEEEVAFKNLEETILSYFEFRGDKLKNMMLESIKNIRNDFPLWEYRGFNRSDKHE